MPHQASRLWGQKAEAVLRQNRRQEADKESMDRPQQVYQKVTTLQKHQVSENDNPVP